SFTPIGGNNDRDMKTMWIKIHVLTAVMAAATLSLNAQDAPQPNNPQQEQTSDADAGQRTNDTPGAAEAAAATNSDNAADTSSTGGTASSAAAVTTPTPSSSGSPAVLSRNDGEGRDGTNTVQRATHNMAGSPVNGVRIPASGRDDANTELQDRQN